ncbi:hypothetical protein HUU59_01230 [bacterium]|nr:hypothetical protein [bacterium]
MLDNVSGQLLDYPMGPAEASAISDSCETITVSWVPALGDFGYYEVFRDGVLLATLPNTSVSYEDANAVGGNTYAYTVVAVNDTCGASMDSTTVEIELVPGSPPAAPEVVITTEGLDAHLSWSVVDTSVSGCAVSGLWYAVFYSPTSGGPFYYHGWTPDTTYTHEGVVNFSATQFYQVTAVDAPSALASSFVKGMEMGEVLGKIGKRK